MKRKGYSVKTKKAYLGHAERFIQQSKVAVNEVSREHLDAYVLRMIEDERSHSYVNQAISALRFWFRDALKRYDIPKQWTRPKKDKILPAVLSEHEVFILLEASPNLKHRLLLTLVYSSGLRVSEVVRLQRKDVDYSRKMIHFVRQKEEKTAIACYLIRLLICSRVICSLMQ